MFQEKNLHIWIDSYLKSLFTKKRRDNSEPLEIYFMVADHFEPFWNKVTLETACRRVDSWCENWPLISKRFRDSEGCHPKHTFYYPQEDYDPEILGKIAFMCRSGWGDVEIHLHHDGDTSEELRKKIVGFKELLWSRHGLLRKHPETGEIRYGFIHGNWALDNSRRDGRWCGVNDEISILRETGCYADFTLPSAPSDTQTKKINSIYYATDDPNSPKSHDKGVDVQQGKCPTGDLMIIQGPLTIDWRRRKYGILPRIENGDISFDFRVTQSRLKLWVRNAPSVIGRAGHIFIKVHTHGCKDVNLQYLLHEGGLKDIYENICSYCEDQTRYRLHFVTAYEFYCKIKELEGMASVKDTTK